ncbi:hypothetical protein C7999DRAFT_39652 [Corynascus novoguineensis]|uniref:DUF6536 domain-containing protein n=1 Tax=Corynascus novoguineensis TaxID=1126955 RepID=A0AAN7CWM3_9PEZI|nr:hypothetical protein C7999DRAFT_39652 [Corynascus novoguineensis]
MFAGRARWEKASFLFCTGSLIAFIANLTFTAWAVTRPGSNIHNGVGELTGVTSCSRAKSINTGIHVLINVLSTILLAGSNYCMQILSAPTREQIDEAHRKSKWVDVGVQSVRNIFGTVSAGNALLWVLLSLSSLPLHLFYNSAIFTSISANEYNVTVVPSSFITIQNRSALPANFRTPRLNILYDAAISGRLIRMDREECLDTYARNFQSSYGELLLVTPDPTKDGTDLPSPHRHPATLALANFGCGIRQPYQWMCTGRLETEGICGTPCEDVIPEFRADPDQWQPFGVGARGGVAECYALPTEERCRLLFSPTLCWVVTGLNLVKGVLMLVTALRGRRKEQGGVILTMGDAVASFLRVPDEATADMCLASKEIVVAGTRTGLWSREPRTVTGWRRRKFVAASSRRWMVCVLLYVLAISACAGLYQFGQGYIAGDKDFASLMALGLGTLNSKTLMQLETMGSGFDNLLSNVVIANSPQAIMSMLYFTYNGLFTSISLATEWDTYANHRKGLRVSAPAVSAQRATYFLQLPFRYSLPLLATSGVMHWLISQSIFLVFVEVYQEWIEGSGVTVRILDYTTCGWSPAGVFSVMMVGAAMVVFLVASGARRLNPYMPVVGSCSAAISAACHLVPYEKTAYKEPLQWGATNHEGYGKGHCSFSNSEVEPPIKGVMYS